MSSTASTPDLITRHLAYLRVQRRLAARTLAMYQDAFKRLATFCTKEALSLPAVKPHHVRGWAARLHASGLGPRSIAITLSAWRGLFRWMGREGLATINPVDGVRVSVSSQFDGLRIKFGDGFRCSASSRGALERAKTGLEGRLTATRGAIGQKTCHGAVSNLLNLQGKV